MKNYLFEVTGGWTIDNNLHPEPDYSGNICSFILPDGKIVRLVVSLEIEDKNGNISYVTSEKGMEKLGFTSLDYDKSNFVESEQDIQTILNHQIGK